MTRPEITQLLGPIFSWRHKKDKRVSNKSQLAALFTEAVIPSTSDIDHQHNHPDEHLHITHAPPDQGSNQKIEARMASGPDPIQSEHIMPDIYTTMARSVYSRTDLLQIQTSSNKPILRHVQQSNNLRAQPQLSPMTLTSQKKSDPQSDLYHSLPGSDLSGIVVLEDSDLGIESTGLPLPKHGEYNSCSRFVDILRITAEQALLYPENDGPYDTCGIENADKSQIPGHRARRGSSSSDETLLGSIYGHPIESEDMLQQFPNSQLPKIDDLNSSRSRRPRPARLNLVASSFHPQKSPSFTNLPTSSTLISASSTNSTFSPASPTSLASAASTISTFSLPQTPATSVWKEQIQDYPNSDKSDPTGCFSRTSQIHSGLDDNFIHHYASDETLTADKISLVSRFDIPGLDEDHSLIEKMSSINLGEDNISETPILKRYNKTLHFDATKRTVHDVENMDKLYSSKPQSCPKAPTFNLTDYNVKVKRKPSPNKTKCSYGLFPQV
ncbi:hypothetical protein K3495_g7555 [Podosphaera aphanis]|nr:hypothetical protein K3495_g7555 [Podosphaera aphanis]